MKESFIINTKGHTDIIDISEQVAAIIKKSIVREGIALVFVSGSTVAITSLEYEAGVLQNFKEVLEKIAPEDANYYHHQKWQDQNGAAHLKSAIIGTDFSVPIVNGQMLLGAWQQIVLIDFDEKPREREIIVKIVKG